jgi:hypothetical protein
MQVQHHGTTLLLGSYCQVQGMSMHPGNTAAQPGFNAQNSLSEYVSKLAAPTVCQGCV